MNKKTWNGFSFLLVAAGIVIGMILASGAGLTGDANADYPDVPGVEAGGERSGDTDNVAGNTGILALSNAFADVAEKVNPAVVTISIEKQVDRSRGFEFFFRGGPDGGPQKGLGSGVLIDSDGVILTNNHVVEGADQIYVRLIDGRKFEATVKGVDKRTDLAVISIDAKNLPYLKLGDSDALRVGEWVLAVGSPLEEDFHHTVTSGIVSAKGRTGVGLTHYEDFIQTDAAINPGNSGGALVNLRGELIGINTAIASRGGGSIGIGFAIPSNLANKVKNDILTKGRAVRGWLGVEMQGNAISQELADMYGLKTNEGVLISSVFVDSPAEKGGLEAGDIILEVDNKKIRNRTELGTKIGSTEPGTKINVKVNREGKEIVLPVVLDEFKEDASLVSNAAPGNSPDGKSFPGLGIEIRDLNDNLRNAYGLRSRDQGVLITSITQGSAMDRAGLQEGDLVMKVNRRYTDSSETFSNALNEVRPGGAVLFYIKRDDRRIVRDFVMPRN